MVRDDGAVTLRHFNQTGWTAIFNGTDTEIGRMVRVEGWDQATGTALVVDPKRGALRPVTDYEDFSHLERADQVVAAVPGGGWRVHWKDEGPGGTPLTASSPSQDSTMSSAAACAGSSTSAPIASTSGFT
ncbi:hypothetical protein AB0M64_31930, partial [Streptomyces sp. NPDC051771]|uniref:hypothetical protein n=1 Tax=Streptomyces sp. NPDC051771 TaxID=3154847 RepID=UPI003446A599